MKNLLGKIYTLNSIFGITLALTGIHQNAHAVASAHASASDFRYVLTDLNPNDGITPSFSWIESPYYGEASLSAWLRGSIPYFLYPKGDAPLMGEWEEGGDTASVRIEGATQLDRTAVGASVTSTGKPYIDYASEASARSIIGGFLLSPGSAVSFLVEYNVSALMTDSRLEYSRAGAEAEMSGSIFGPGGIEAENELESAHISAFNLTTDGQVRNGTLSFTLSNATDLYSEGTLRFETYAYAVSVVDPIPTIPESATWAMLLGGLALLRRYATNVNSPASKSSNAS